MPMLVLGTWLVLVLALFGSDRGLRESALGAFAILSVTVLLSVEALSVFRALSFPWLAAFWAFTLVATAMLLRRRLAQGAQRLRVWRPPLARDRWDWVTTAIVATFALGTLLSAVLYPPVNIDSLTYHMPRIFFWTQNHGVGLYPTIEGRQLFSAAFVEYFAVTLRVLSGGTDRVVNIVQWLSYLFAILTASLIARELGAGRRGQQAVAVLAATVPMAVLQASTTQNDLTSALWILVLAFCVVRKARANLGSRRTRMEWAALLAASLALAVQSKPPAYVMVAPFLLWLPIITWRRRGAVRTLALATTVIAFAAVPLAGTFLQNARVGVDVVGVRAPGNERILVKSWAPKDVLITGLKNASMLFGTPSSLLNEAEASVVRLAAAEVHADIDNPKTREWDAAPYALDTRIANHDIAPSPLPVLLSVVAGIAILARRSRRRLGWPYLACAFAAMLVPAAIINYNHYIVRVLLPAVLLLAPVVGPVIDPTTEAEPVGRPLRTLLVGLLSLSVLWGGGVLLFNTTNRLVSPALLRLAYGRDVGFWNTSYEDLRVKDTVPEYGVAFDRIASAIRVNRAQTIGIYQHEVDMPIYPLLVKLSDRRWGYTRDTVLPGKIDDEQFRPEVILEIAEDKQYPAILHNGVPRGELLIPPQHAADWWFLVYRSPGPMGVGSGDVPTLK